MEAKVNYPWWYWEASQYTKQQYLTARLRAETKIDNSTTTEKETEKC